MKLSEILTETRNGALINKIAINDASKVVANSNGEMSFATTLFQKKYAYRNEGDEIISSLNGTKETNVTTLKNVIIRHSDLEMTIRIGKINYSGIIEIDE